jgi:hypothetical protein
VDGVSHGASHEAGQFCTLPVCTRPAGISDESELVHKVAGKGRLLSVVVRQVIVQDHVQQRLVDPDTIGVVDKGLPCLQHVQIGSAAFGQFNEFVFAGKPEALAERCPRVALKELNVPSITASEARVHAGQDVAMGTKLR